MKIHSVLLFVLGLNCYTIIFAAHQDIITEVLQNAPMPCEEAGFFRHPLDCRYFYRCVARTYGNFQRYIFSCPFYTVFDSETSVCVPPFMTNLCDTVDPPSPMLKLDQYYNRFSAGFNQGFNEAYEVPVTAEDGEAHSQTRQKSHPLDSLSESENSLSIQDLELINSQDYQVPHLEELKGQFGEGMRQQSQTYREETEPTAVEVINTDTEDYEEITSAEELTTKASTKTYPHKQKTRKPLTKKPVNTYKESTTDKPQETTYKEATTTKLIKKTNKPIKKYKDSTTTTTTTKAAQTYKDSTTESVPSVEDITTEKPIKRYRDSTTVKPKSPKTQKPTSKYIDSSTKKPNLEPETKKPVETYRKVITKKPIKITKAPSHTYKNENQISTFDEEYHELDQNMETTTSKNSVEVLKNPSNTYQEQSNLSTDDDEYQENKDNFNIKSKTKTQFHINIKNSKNKDNSQKNSNSQDYLIGSDEQFGEEFQIHGGPIGVKTPILDQQEQKTTGQNDEKIIEKHENEHEYLDESEEISGDSNLHHSHSFSQVQPSSEDKEHKHEFIGYEDLAQVTKNYNKPNYRQKITHLTKKTYESTSTPSTPLPSTTPNIEAKKNTYSKKESNIQQSSKVDYGQTKKPKPQKKPNDRYKEKQVSHESNMELSYENNEAHPVHDEQQSSRAPMEVIINTDYEDAFNNDYVNNDLGSHVRVHPGVHPGHRRKETLENSDWHSYSTNQPIEQDEYEYNYQESPQFSETEINPEQYEHHIKKVVKPIKVAAPSETNKKHNKNLQYVDSKQNQGHAEDYLYEEILNEFEPSNKLYTLPPYHRNKIDVQLDDSSFYDDLTDIEEAVTPKSRPTRPTRPIRPTRRPHSVKPNIQNIDLHNNDDIMQEENSDYKSNQEEFEQLDENSDQNSEEVAEGLKEKANPGYKKKTTVTTTTTSKKPKYEHKTSTTTTTQKPRYKRIKTKPSTTITTTTTTTPKPRYEHRKPTPKVIIKTKPPTYKQSTEKPATTTDEHYEYFDEELTTTNAIYGKEPEKQAEEIKTTTVVSIISSSGEYEDYEEDIVQLETTTTAHEDNVSLPYNENDFVNVTTTELPVAEVSTSSNETYDILTEAHDNITEEPTHINIVTNTPFHLPNVPAAGGPEPLGTTTPHTVIGLNGSPAIVITTAQSVKETSPPNLLRPATGTLNDRTENKPPHTNNILPTSNLTPVPSGNTAFETASGNSDSAPISTDNSESPAPVGTPSRNPLEPPPLAARDMVGTSLKRKLENEK